MSSPERWPASASSSPPRSNNRTAQLRRGLGASGDRGLRYRGDRLFGGQGTIGGTLIGALLIAVVTDGAVLLNITQYYQQVIIGVIIWAAVWWIRSAVGGCRPRPNKAEGGTAMTLRRMVTTAVGLLVTAIVTGCSLVTTHKDHVTSRALRRFTWRSAPASVGLDDWEKVQEGVEEPARPAQIGKRVLHRVEMGHR